MLIVIEGIDDTGKSTQAARLAEWFREMGREVVVGSEPTRGRHGMKLRESFTAGRLAPEEELRLFLEDRREHVALVIAPALAVGKVVILDRYYFSNMAYQGAIGFDPQTIRRRNEAFAPVPDLLFVLELDTGTALARIGARGDRVPQPIDVGDAQSARALPVEDFDAAVGLARQPVRDFARAVR